MNMKSKIVNTTSTSKTQSISTPISQSQSQPLSQPNNSFEEEYIEETIEQESIDSIPKFLTKVKIIQQLCSLPFASVRVFLNSKDYHQTQYGYNVKVLMILFIDENMKPVKIIKPIDSSFSVKFVHRIQYVYVDIENKQQMSEKGNLFYSQLPIQVVKPEIIKKLKLDELVKKESKKKVTKEIDYDLIEQM
ncbi:Hypothetical_protein [Hexamita inflata]|uniref:Hypothetical_protein n=1 Tax=Hexamita inflata TaxID=28002 RepID=A0AA86PP90_9EUKA|nr:Hypothetical protein HINF_LOCUS30831 [Hexamita inflata]